MISDLKPTGASPNFSVKNEWAVVRLWEIARIRSEKNHSDLPLLSVFLDRGVIPYDEGGGQVHKPGLDLSVYQVVRRGDFVLNNQQAWRGSVGVSKYDGIISPAYVVLALGEALNPRFSDYLFQSRDMVAQYVTSSKGVGDIQRDIHIPWLKNVKVALPPPAEQTAIVRFLDYADRRIRSCIRAKQKLVKLLEEQKRAIIHYAVTRSLDPSVRLKPSGVKWLGEIPESWETWQLGHFCRLGNGSTPSRSNPAYWSGGRYPWLNSSHANSDRVIEADQFVTDIALRECHLPVVSPGSVLVAITGQGKTRGKAAVLCIEATINQHLAFLRPRTDICSPTFLQAALTGAYSFLRAMSEDSGSTRGALTCTGLSHFKVALPPAGEQERILTSIGSQTRNIDDAIQKTLRETEFLREYRARVVSEVVTGKLDVRGVVEQLPKESRELALQEGLNELVEEDQESGETELVDATGEADA